MFPLLALLLVLLFVLLLVFGLGRKLDGIGQDKSEDDDFVWLGWHDR